MGINYNFEITGINKDLNIKLVDKIKKLKINVNLLKAESPYLLIKEVKENLSCNKIKKLIKECTKIHLKLTDKKELFYCNLIFDENKISINFPSELFHDEYHEKYMSILKIIRKSIGKSEVEFYTTQSETFSEENLSEEKFNKIKEDFQKFCFGEIKSVENPYDEKNICWPKTIYVYCKQKTNLNLLFEYLASKGFSYDSEMGYMDCEEHIKMDAEKAKELMNKEGGSIIFFNPDYDFFLYVTFIKFLKKERLFITNMPTDEGLSPQKIIEKLQEIKNYIMRTYKVKADLCVFK